MKLIGVEKKSFVAKDGTTIDGYDMFVVVPDDKFGERCEKVFLKSDKVGNSVPKVGQEVFLQFNQYGKLQAVRAL